MPILLQTALAVSECHEVPGPDVLRNNHELIHSTEEKRLAGVIFPARPVCVVDRVAQEPYLARVAAGVKVPEELDVVAHCNFPCPTPSAVPAKRIGYNIRRALDMCIDCIDLITRRQIGERVPDLISLPACTEDEASACEKAVPAQQ